MNTLLRLTLLAGVGCFSASSALAQVKIAQIYGGNTTAATAGSWRQDYVVLKNTSSSAVDLSSYVLHYSSSTGAFQTTASARAILTGSIPAYSYYLIALATSASGNALPIAPDFTQTNINASGTAGKFALTSANVLLSTTCPTVADTPSLVDFVGYGSGVNCSETAAAPAPSATTTLFRRLDGCADLNNNAVDFSAAAAGAADFRNSATPGTGPCSSTIVDYGLSVTQSPICEVAVGALLTQTFTFTNAAGGTPGTGAGAGAQINITVLGNSTFVSAVASDGTAFLSGASISWTPTGVDPGESGTLTVTYLVATEGSASNSATFNTTDTDINSANDLVGPSSFALPAATPARSYVLTNLTAAPLAKRSFFQPNGGGVRPLRTGTTVDPFSRWNISPDSSAFSFVINLDDTNIASDQGLVHGRILSGGALVMDLFVQEGFTEVTPGETMLTFDGNSYINDAGQMAFSGLTNGNTAIDTVVLRREIGSALTVIARESTATGFDASLAYGNTNNALGITADGRVLFYTNLVGATTATDTAIILASGSAAGQGVIVAQEGVTNVSAGAVPAGDSATYKGFDTGSGFNQTLGGTITADGLIQMISGTINTAPVSALNDNVLTRNHVSLVQEARQMAAPEPYSGGITATTFLHGYSMDAAGHWVAIGSNTGTGQDWAITNAGVLARTGDPIVPASSETWSDSNPLSPGGVTGYTDCYFSCYVNGPDAFVGGITSEPDRTRNGVIVHNGTTVLLREGDAIDIDGNGRADDSAFVSIFRNGRIMSDPVNRKAYLQVEVRATNGTCGGALTSIGYAVIVVNLPPIPVARCQPADIADDAGNPLPSNGPNNGVNEGDYNAFFNNFFTNQNVGSPADIASDDGTPLPPFGAPGLPNNGVNEGDYNAFFNNFFNGCPA